MDDARHVSSTIGGGVVREKEIVTCKYCGEQEYYMDMRWLSGKEMCRDCYKNEYEDRTGKLYEWDDLDGGRPKKEVE